MLFEKKLSTKKKNICPTLLTMFMLISKEFFVCFRYLFSKFLSLISCQKNWQQAHKDLCLHGSFSISLSHTFLLENSWPWFPISPKPVGFLLIFFMPLFIFSSTLHICSAFLPSKKPLGFILLARFSSCQSPTAISFWIHRISFDLRS